MGKDREWLLSKVNGDESIYSELLKEAILMIREQQQEIERLIDNLAEASIEIEPLKKEKSFYQKRVKYLESMIDNGLGWDDVKAE